MIGVLRRNRRSGAGFDPVRRGASELDAGGGAGIGARERALPPPTGDAPLPGLRTLLLRQALPLAVIALLLLVLWDRLQALDFEHVFAALQTVSPLQWLFGTLFTALSFWALGRYDRVVHQVMGTGIGPREAVRTGMAAIAVAQTVGMGAVTGAFVRWRLLPSLNLVTASKLSIFVAISFLAGWAVVSAATLLFVDLPLPGARPIALMVLLAAALLAATALLRPQLVRPQLLFSAPLARLTLPPLRAMGAIVMLTALDTFAAGMVLWTLLPAEIALPPLTLIAAYLLALGAGLILTTPGGVGPFEVALLALLPAVPAEPLLAAVLAYRALYYALPALIGAAVLIRGPLQEHKPEQPALNRLPAPDNLPMLIEAVIDQAPRAETALLRHGHLQLLNDANQRPAAMAAPAGQSLVSLLGPLYSDCPPDTFLDTLSNAARTRLRTPVLYKAPARIAARARARGWSVLAIAREAWVNPQSFDENGPKRRQLRRKLRKAESAGLHIEIIPPGSTAPLPLAEMAEIAENWQRERGGERGFSMGKWNPDGLHHALVLLARCPDEQGRVAGFITVHLNQNEAVLDLLRPGPNAPDGLMHLLVTRAIETAKTRGLTRFSLAAVPVEYRAQDPWRFRILRQRINTAAGAAGLRQFKSSFAPRWETLYMAAPTPRSLAIGMLDVMREIRPARRQPRKRRNPFNLL